MLKKLFDNVVVIFVGGSISDVVYVCYRAAFNRESVESDLALPCASMLPDWFKKIVLPV